MTQNEYRPHHLAAVRSVEKYYGQLFKVTPIVYERELPAVLKTASNGNQYAEKAVNYRMVIEVYNYPIIGTNPKTGKPIFDKYNPFGGHVEIRKPEEKK